MKLYHQSCLAYYEAVLYFKNLCLFLGIQALQDVNNKHTVSLFDVHDNFKVKIHCAQYVTVKELGNVSIQWNLNNSKSQGPNSFV